jgi:hypothetical protein
MAHGRLEEEDLEVTTSREEPKLRTYAILISCETRTLHLSIALISGPWLAFA